ncbi:MAG: hypothetical protein CMA18_002965 [Methanobacteriota archaeon]|nr:MAG: hypothetical protein CBC63_06695 [Euryarchaeota archaeon TMED103]RAH11676.1 MAG: hypothetical protein CMA18_002965 [Euryarchaeota archaeon]|tara:strand:+ start:18118 stop:19140 length:1023 start_codon:yes stop_codon:yes gene_type:complete
MRTSKPWLATILPVLNEEGHIEACLQSLLRQSIPPNEHMIVVLDGGSTDRTKDLVQSIKDGVKIDEQPLILLIDNPNRFVPHARNLALQNLPDSVTHLLEFNGHIEAEPDHLSKMKAIWHRLEEQHPSIAGLGCRVVGSQGEQSAVESIIDSTLRSPFGGSTGQFATFETEGRTNVPAFALHRRSALEAIGGWDESFLTSQDSDLSMRLKKAGYSLFRTPNVVVKMRRRTSYKSWLLMSHRYGFWRTKVLLKHPKRIVLRELMPLFGLILTSILLTINPIFAAIPIGAYACVLFGSGLLNIRKGISHVIGVPFALLTLHVGFTFGLVDGLVRKGRASHDR